LFSIVSNVKYGYIDGKSDGVNGGSFVTAVATCCIVENKLYLFLQQFFCSFCSNSLSTTITINNNIIDELLQWYVKTKTDLDQLNSFLISNGP